MNKLDNRENILIISLKLFAERGYNSVGIQEIVNKAKITKPTLYHYYGNKRGLLEAIFAKYYVEMIERLKFVGDYQGDLIKTLTDLVHEYFDYAVGNKEFFYLRLSMSFVPISNETYSIIEPYHNELNDFLINMFKSSIQEHGNLKGHEDILAKTLMGILNHYALEIVNGSLKKTEDLVYKVVKQYMHGIYVL